MGYSYIGPQDQTICVNCIAALGQKAAAVYRKMYGLPGDAKLSMQANLKDRTMEVFHGDLPREVFTFEDLGIETC